MVSLGLTRIASFKPVANQTGIRIEDVAFGYEEFLYRAPYKFGGVPVDRATILNVNVVVRKPRR